MQADIAPRHKGPLALPPGNGHVHHVHGDSAPTDAVKNRRRGKDQLHAGDDNDVFLVELLSADHPSVIHHNPIGTAIVHDKIPGGFPDNPPMNLGNTHVGESTMSQASARPRVIPITDGLRHNQPVIVNQTVCASGATIGRLPSNMVTDSPPASFAGFCGDSTYFIVRLYSCMSFHPFTLSSFCSFILSLYGPVWPLSPFTEM